MLDHWQVSRRHAYLQLIEGRYLLRRPGEPDRDPRRRRVRAVRAGSSAGRAIQIGPVRGPARSGPSRPPASPGRRPAVTWELPGRAIGQAVWRMDRQLVLIGRSPACRIRIVEPDVSKFHCSLVLTPMGVWAVDLLGQKGVFVNDEPVRCARLEDGDELRVGRHALRPRYDAAARPGPARPGPGRRRPAAGSRRSSPPRPAVRRRRARRPARRPGPPARPGDRRPPASGPAAIADPTVGALVQQFGLMQQQMFDQFHQTMMMMFEGFAALHREQSGDAPRGVRAGPQAQPGDRGAPGRDGPARRVGPGRRRRPRAPANGHARPPARPPARPAAGRPDADPAARPRPRPTPRSTSTPSSASGCLDPGRAAEPLAEDPRDDVEPVLIAGRTGPIEREAAPARGIGPRAGAASRIDRRRAGRVRPPARSPSVSRPGGPS